MLVGNYSRLLNTKKTVNCRLINKFRMHRKIRIASYVPFVRLVKHSHFVNSPIVK